MKQLLIASAATSTFAAPILASPLDAFTLCALLFAAGLGYTVISDAASDGLQWAESRVRSPARKTMP